MNQSKFRGIRQQFSYKSIFKQSSGSYKHFNPMATNLYSHKSI